MHRFFVAPEAIANGTAVIEGEDVQHIKGAALEPWRRGHALRWAENGIYGAH